MGSASREALAAAQASLSGLLGKTVGSDLLAVAAQLDTSPALVSALADSSLAAEAKTGILSRVFGSLSDGARSVLTAAVTQNWSSAPELVDGIEELGIRAQAVANSELADELLAATAVIDGSHELELELGNKLGDPNAKAGLAEKIFSGKLSASAMNVITYFVAHPRGRRVSAALRESARTAADQGGSELATVTVAAPLSDAQQQKLASLLEQSAGRPVKVTTVVDSDLIGGVRIQIANDVIDGSVRARLDDLRQRLAA
ncbi:F0F1 ATP synthase subunit delta [Leucobacter denitrificans]|uniref:ATP synthase subunit delta n=1 Tax=Leucobacter denitrificans TaxID=683042 RepID=A0A7G9S4H4_9MICO|nr:F0F1 ATP synthase subunit delta [Leucobacter denitrificans]QNN62749.1 F0F1 ATP synthase subunit delta [Leucobacter denitrificans]